jgi:hypothetical protein
VLTAGPLPPDPPLLPESSRRGSIRHRRRISCSRL